MKCAFYIAITVLTFSMCTKYEEPNLTEYIIQGTIISGEEEQRIRVTRLYDVSKEEGVTGAAVILKKGNQSVLMSGQGNGYYAYTGGEMSFNPEDSIELRVEIMDEVLTATAQIPNNMDILVQSQTEIDVNVNTSGSIVYFMEWEELANHGQIATLENKEIDPVVIPFVNPVEDFEDLYSLPLPGPSIVLRDLNFPYYGTYELTVYLCEQEYADWFFYELQSGQNTPPEGFDNIQGGSGYFTALNKNVIELEINEN